MQQIATLTYRTKEQQLLVQDFVWDRQELLGVPEMGIGQEMSLTCPIAGDDYDTLHDMLMRGQIQAYSIRNEWDIVEYLTRGAEQWHRR